MFTVPRLGVQGRNPASRKQNWKGPRGPIWQQRNMAAWTETEKGSSRQGLSGPREWGRRFEGTDTGLGLTVLSAACCPYTAWQGWWGRRPLPHGTECGGGPWVFLTNAWAVFLGGGVGVIGQGQVLAPSPSLAPWPWLPEH